MVGAMLLLVMVVVPTSGVATYFGLRLNDLPGRITERQEKSTKVYVALTSCHPRSIESDTNFPPAYDPFWPRLILHCFPWKNATFYRWYHSSSLGPEGHADHAV